MRHATTIMTLTFTALISLACAGENQDLREAEQNQPATQADQLNLEMSERLAGDANLDGRFDSSDLVILTKSGKYETGLPATWEEGDFNGDGVYNSSDMVLLMQSHCNYEQPCAVEADDGAKYAPGDATRDNLYNSADILAMYTSGKYETGEPAEWHEGDFNGDGTFNSSDIVAIYQFGCEFEGEACILEEQGIDAPADTGELPETLDALPGDTNGDGVFNSSDLVNLLQSNKYETGEPASWEEGDWNGDGVFNSSDIVLWQQTGAPMTE